MKLSATVTHVLLPANLLTKHEMAQSSLLDGVEYDASLALRSKVLSLYSLDTNTDAVIAATYHRHCKFVDPLVSVRGHREVKAQFRILRTFLWKSKAELVSSHYDTSTRTLTMDMKMVFKPLIWPFSSFSLRCFTVVVVDRHGLVRSHTDHWSLASLIETKLGWVYNIVRRAIGAATSLVFTWITKDKTPLILNGKEDRAATAPDALFTAINAKAD